jgi:hypothetical protein
MVKTLDKLLEGIRLVPDRVLETEENRMTPQEYSEYDNHRHIYTQQGIEICWSELEVIRPRTDEMLDLYDRVVLNGYSEEKDQKYLRELDKVCIPCFARLPEDEPPFIKLIWALMHYNKPHSMDYVDICDEIGDLEGEELERFAYFIRRNFVNGMGSARRDYDYHRRTPIGERPEPLDDLDDESEEVDQWLDLREEKELIWSKMRGTKVLYQTMIELIKRKS